MTSHQVRGGLKNVSTCDKDGGEQGFKKSLNLCVVIYGWPHIYDSDNQRFRLLFHSVY